MVSVTADSSIRLTEVLTLMVPQTSKTTMRVPMMDGYTQHGFMTDQPILERSTSMELKITLVRSELLTVAVLSSLVDVTAVATDMPVLLTRSLSGTLLHQQNTLLSLPLVRAHSTTTVTDSLIHGQLDSVSLTQTQMLMEMESPTQTNS